MSWSTLTPLICTGTLVLFDVGLGAGTNAVLAWRASEERSSSNQRRLSIVSFETSLAAFELALRPEHHEAFGSVDVRQVEGCRLTLAIE